MLARSTREGNFSGPDEETFLAGYDFTNRVRGALIKARDEAHHRNHQYVGTEHLLIGLLAEDWEPTVERALHYLDAALVHGDGHRAWDDARGRRFAHWPLGSS